jgi:hypothetical protein
MIENLPDYVSWTFIVTTFLTVGFLLYAARQTNSRKNFPLILAVTLVLLMIVHAVLAARGFYLVTSTVPPRFPLAPMPTIIILLAFFIIFAKKSFTTPALKALTFLHVVRIPVEIVLLWLYQNGLVPQLMTFEGRNFDILSGLTAPLVAWLAFRGGKTNRPLLIVWNLAALGLLFNILTNAILSLPAPFQQFAFDQPNRGVLYFPFIWLPAIIVPVVFVSHLISLWKLFSRSE